VTPLRIAAVATLTVAAGAEPEPLRPKLKDLLPQAPRRINRLTELALLGVHRCLRDRRPEPHCPVFLAVTTGCVADIVQASGATARDQPPTPINFINLSSNMTGFYVASTLGLHGSNQSVATDDIAFEAALELASLGSSSPQRLIGAVEECAWPLDAHRERLGLPAGRPLSECSHWLFVDPAVTRPLATVQWVRRYASAAEAHAALAQERWPEGTIRIERARDPDPHTGHAAAQAICGFIERRPGPALLHLGEGRQGCYAVLVTAG
jgi:hypothetical protein